MWVPRSRNILFLVYLYVFTEEQAVGSINKILYIAGTLKYEYPLYKYIGASVLDGLNIL